VVSSKLDNRKAEATGQLVAVVARGQPHRRDRAAFLEEKKKRKAAQRETSKLHKVVKLMQRAAAADAEGRVEQEQRRKSEEADGTRVEKERAREEEQRGTARAGAWEEQCEKARAELEQTKSELAELGAVKAQMREVEVAKAREEAKVEIDREKEEARGQVRAAEARAEQAEVRAAVAEARVAAAQDLAAERAAHIEQRKTDLQEAADGCTTWEESARLQREHLLRERRAAEAALQEEVRVVTRERDHLRSCSRVQAISEEAAQVDPAVKGPTVRKAPAVRKAPVQKPAKKRPAPFGKKEDKHRWDQGMGGEPDGGQVYGWHG
jgi:hypothetical protein